MIRQIMTIMMLTISISVFGQNFSSDSPTMGWSSWNTYGFQISEDIIKSQADAMVNNGYSSVGYKYINIDDGYFGGRDQDGHLLIHPTRFPNGLRPLVDYIHSLGLKAGIYSDAGSNTCASYFGGDTIGIGVGLYGHDQEDCDLFFKTLGFDFIKIDFCGGSPFHNRDKLYLSERDRYTSICDAIKETGRIDVRVNVCRWDFPGTWVKNVASSWRTTGDINCSWRSVKSILKENVYLSAYCSGGNFNDMDMLEVGRGLSDEEDKTHFGMWCIMDSPLLIGCDMNKVSPAAHDLLCNRELIALNQDPLFQQAYVVSRDGDKYVMVKDIEKLNGKVRAVALMNLSDESSDMSVDFISLDLSGKVKVRDLFSHSDLGTMSGSLSAYVPAHGTRIYRLEGSKRLERTQYEGETAYLSSYQELKNNQTVPSAIYVEDDHCSGGAKVSWLGGSSLNDIQWQNVYSKNGGKYRLSINFISGEDRSMTIEVNGEILKDVRLNSGGWDVPGNYTLNVNLKPGNNTIRFFSSSGWIADIDYIKVEKI